MVSSQQNTGNCGRSAGAASPASSDLSRRNFVRWAASIAAATGFVAHGGPAGATEGNAAEESGGVGALFGVVGARPYWHTGLLPILFVSGSLLSGAAMVNALTWVLRPAGGDGRTADRVVFLGRIILLLLLFYVLLEWAEYSIAWYAAIPSHTASLELVLFGPYWWAFWMIHVGAGVLVPLALLTVKAKSPAAVAAACGLIAITFLAVRVNIVIPGLAVEELQGLARAYVHPRLSFDYFPTVTEWLVQIWIIALAGVLFLLGYRWLPILSRKEASRA